MKWVPFHEWTRRGVWGSPAPFRGPSAAVVIHHSVTNTGSKSAIEQARQIEDVIYSRRFTAGFSTIAYNAIIARSGAVFEGRGFKWRNGANNRTKSDAPPYDNRSTISICFAGNYHPGVAGLPTLIPTAAQLAAAGQTIRDGIAAGRIAGNPPVLPHSALHGTACCGDNLRSELHRIDTQGHPMPLHPDAQAAMDAGIWNGSDATDPATREHAAIMAWRARTLAINHADQAIADAIASLVTDPPAAPPSTVTLASGESVTITAQ